MIYPTSLRSSGPGVAARPGPHRISRPVPWPARNSSACRCRTSPCGRPCRSRSARWSASSSIGSTPRGSTPIRSCAKRDSLLFFFSLVAFSAADFTLRRRMLPYCTLDAERRGTELAVLVVVALDQRREVGRRQAQRLEHAGDVELLLEVRLLRDLPAPRCAAWSTIGSGVAGGASRPSQIVQVVTRIVIGDRWQLRETAAKTLRARGGQTARRLARLSKRPALEAPASTTPSSRPRPSRCRPVRRRDTARAACRRRRAA